MGFGGMGYLLPRLSVWVARAPGRTRYEERVSVVARKTLKIRPELHVH